MRVLRKDLRHGAVEVLVQTLDDLWHLYNIIEKDDLVHARTTREVKVDNVGRPSSRRMPVSLTLTVDKVYFDRSTTRLRVLGVVTEAPESLHIQGSHHTLNLEPGQRAVIVKERWYSHQLERLQRATTKHEPIVLVAIDHEEACVAVLHSYGLEIKAQILSRLPGKGDPEKRESTLRRYYSEILSLVSSISKDLMGKIVLVGPGFAKEEFAAFVRSKSPQVAARVVGVKSVGSAGEAGAYEAIRSGALDKVLRDSRALEEVSAVEEVLKRLGSSRGDVSYGLEQVSQDAAEGAVGQILVLDQALREAEEARRRLIDEAILNTERKGGRVMIISSEHEGGEKLNSLGGIAAILRYPKHL